MDWQALVVARRLPRHQSGHGMVVRGGVGDAAGERTRCVAALPPIALGHALAVAVVLLAAALAAGRPFRSSALQVLVG